MCILTEKRGWRRMRWIPNLGWRRACSVLLVWVLIAGPVLQAGPAFASLGTSPPAVTEAQVTGLAPAEESPPTVVRELTEKRTENSTSYLLSNGEVRADITQVPTRFEQDDEWVNINTNLVPAKEFGAMETAATAATVTFDAQEPGQAPVTITGSDYEVGLDMLGTAERTPITLGDTTRYLEVMPSVDLEYKAIRTGVKETVILKDVSAATKFQFKIELDGLDVRQDTFKRYTLCRPDGETVFDLGALVVFDSSVNVADEPAYCDDAKMTVAVTGDGGAIVTYDVPQSWVDDPTRVFPIMVDPTITGAAGTADAYYSSAYPTNSYGSSDELKCGYYDSSTGHNRSYVKFGWDTATIPANAYVSSATFSTYMFHQYYATTTTNVRIARVTSPWGGNWNNKPDFNFLGTANVTGRNKWVALEVGPTVQGWVNGESNYGFQLYQLNDSTQNTYYWKKFYSSDYSNPSYLPKLSVTYSNPNVNGSAVDKTVYRVGDTVTATIKVGTTLPEDVNCIQVTLRGTGVSGTQVKGAFQWTEEAPGATWSNVATGLPGTGGGYVSAKSLTGVTFLPTQCTENVPNDSSADNAEVTFKWRIDDSYGDIQNNDIDVVVRMSSTDSNESGNGWSSAVKVVDTSYAVAPKPATGLTYSTTPTSGWFREADRDNDGKADTANDRADQGRGAVDLSWLTSPLADGYRIYAFDGSAYRKVGETIGNGSTTWSSAGARFFPQDSDYTTRADDSWTANPYAAAAPIVSGTEANSIAVPDLGAGVIVSDGSHLYYRAWGTYPGATQWKRISSELNGTTIGGNPDGIGADFASKRIMSAFLLDGIIYNGYATTTTSIEGVPVSAASGDTDKRVLTFSAPLLDRTTGDVLSSASGNVLLTATDERIYSVAFNRNGTDVKDGFKIREFTRDGTFVADRTVTCNSYLTNGVMTDGENLYFIEWQGGQRVTKVSTSSWKITNQYVSNSSNRREISGCYDESNNVFWTGTLDGAGVLRRYAGTGLDLRDNPNQLYGKTPVDTYDTNTNYWFRVVPYSEVAELTVGESPYVMPALDNRTVRVNDDPRHTTYSLGQIRGHEAEAVLDEGALSLGIDDLSIASWGPEAALSRHYSSANAVVSAWAPGWTFNFEQRIQGTGNVRDYVDASGEAHRYTLNATTSKWMAPNGDYSTLDAEGNGWKITTKDRSVLHFDSMGRLTAEDDRNGNRVEYNWNTNRTELRVKAANTQEIVANFTKDGCITDASYAIADSRVPAENRVRKIEYNSGDGYQPGSIQTVRWFPNLTVTEDPDYNPFTSPWNQEVSYYYGVSSRLERIWDSNFVTQSSWGAQWDLTYDEQTGKLAQVIWPGDNLGSPRYAEGNGRRTVFAFGAGEATVTMRAEVDGKEKTVAQLYRWNPTGTEAFHTNKVTQAQLSASSPVWSYTYNPQNEVTSEQSPEEVITRSQYDSLGNVIRSFDGKGGVTKNVFDAADNLVRTTTPAGRTTYLTYDAGGNVLFEERVLSAGGERSRAEYTYDTLGRGLLISERKRISQAPEMWAQTDYVESSFAPNGEAQTIIDRGVKLSGSSAAIDLSKTKAYDDFGNLLWEKDASNQWMDKANSYDVVGRLVSSENASGTISRTVYDKLGFVAESWLEHGEVWANRRRCENTSDGQTYRESYLKRDSDGAIAIDRVVKHVIDPVGNVVEQQSSAGTTAIQYNAQGLPTAQLDPVSGYQGEPIPSTVIYSEDGNLTASTEVGNDEANKTIFDKGGNVVEEDPAGADATTFDYDEDGNETSVFEPTDSGGIIESESFYDVGGRLTKSTDAKSFLTTFTYDQLDRQLAATSGGVSSTKVYNSLGWVLSETNLDGRTKTFTYDEVGRVVSETLSGKATTTSYDGMGRATSKTAPDGSTVAYEYDEFGCSVTEMHTTRSGQVTRAIQRTFDDEGREISVTDTARGVSSSSVWNGETKASFSRSIGDTTVAVTFDAQGSEDSLLSTNATSTVSRQVASRDAAGKVMAYSFGASAPLSQQFSYEAAASKLISQDGAGFGSAGIDYEYNSCTARQTRERIDLAYPVTGADCDRSYVYDDAGRLTKTTDSGSATTNFAYQPDGRITTAGLRNYTYYGETTRAQRLLSMTDGEKTTTYSFDDRGRRSGYVTQEESVIYGYNDDDRLVSFIKDAGKDGSIDVTATYAYDSEGQRIRSVVTSGGATTTTNWTYENLILLRSVAVTNDEMTTVEYVNDDAGRLVGAWVTVPGRPSADFIWFVTNSRGDVLGLLAEDGTPLSYRAYSAYGETISGASRAVDSITATQTTAIDSAVQLRFAGYTFDSESGLYYCSQRYYDPVTCQWLTQDPARADGEESAYQYCGGNPIGNTDPSGLYAMSFIPSKGEQTKYFMRVLKVNAGRAFTQRLRLKSFFWWWFYTAMKSGGAWDLKLTAKGATGKKLCNFKTKNISMEQFGNIHYGYVGAAAGINLPLLYGGSWWAARQTSTAYDEAKDRKDITWGYGLFFKNGMTIRAPWRVDRYVYNYRSAKGF